MKLSRNQNGFSLVELMIVVAIVGILASIAVPKFQTFQAKARQAEAKSNLAHLYTLEHSYFADAETFVAVLAIGLGDCTTNKNALGFTPSPCAKSRYQYTAAIAGGGTQFTATADSTAGAGNKVFPGCADNDTWTIDQDKNLKDTNNAISKCS